jgi:hypothetical protein
METGLAIHGVLEELKVLKRNISASFIQMGFLLKKVRDENLWKGQWESFDNPKSHNFITEIDIGGKSTVNHLITIYEKFVVQSPKDLSELLIEAGWGKLALVAPQVKTPEDAEHWAEMAAHQTKTDLEKTISEAKTGIAPESCEHDLMTITRCKKCHSRFVE